MMNIYPICKVKGKYFIVHPIHTMRVYVGKFKVKIIYMSMAHSQSEVRQVCNLHCKHEYNKILNILIIKF
jgi:hypothetical protein